MRDAKISDTGCYLDNHRGHYISRDTIELAAEFGFIIGPFEQYALNTYEDWHATTDNEDIGLQEALYELCDEAVAWLNSGQSECDKCGGTGIAPEGSDEWFTRKDDPDGIKRCRACTGTGRGDRVKGQNFPPIIPNGYTWAFEDGDFGLFAIEDLSD